MYPWAKFDLLKETSRFTSSETLKTLHNLQIFSKTNEENVVIVPHESGEPICKDNTGDTE